MARFNRMAIVEAYCAFADLNDGTDALTQVAWQARVAKVRDLYSIRTLARGDAENPTDAIESLGSLDEASRDAYVALSARLLGEPDDRDDETIAQAYVRANRKDGVEVHVSNNGDDPFQVDFTINDPVADAWANAHGSLGGGTWEGTGDPGFVYDSTCWHEDLVEDLQREGFDLDLSEYGEPDADDLRVMDHIHGTVATDDAPATEGCEACQNYGYRDGVKHLEELDAAREAAEEHAVAIAPELFAAALDVISHVGEWAQAMRGRALFSSRILMPRARWLPRAVYRRLTRASTTL
jgi:hypothetical protein